MKFVFSDNVLFHELYSKIIIGIILFSFFSNASEGQYFSNTYSLYAGTNGYISSIQVVNDTIYAMCYVGDSVDPAISIAAFERFDKSGNLISYNPLDTPILFNILANNNNLIHTNDGGFAYGASIAINSIQNALVMIKYDHYGNLQWYKEIIDSNSLSFNCTALTQDSLSNYYIAGAVQLLQNPNSDIYLAKTDSFGNVLLMKIFEDTNFYVGTSGLYVSKTRIVMGCGRAYVDPNNFSTEKDYLEIYELDTGLNIIKHILGTDSSGHDAGFLQSTSDGGYMCSSGPICYQDINTIENKASVHKLDSNFQVVWNIDVGTCSQNTGFNAIKKCPDGNWIAVGQWYDEVDTATTHINGWVMKYSEGGQIIWSKLYRGVTSIGGNGDNNVLGSIAFMSDGSILCAGQATNDDDTIPPAQQGWLLHLDTAGCIPDSNSCGLPDGIINMPSQSMGRVKVYPNPASDQIWFDIQMDEPTAYTLSITNILGQTISETSPSQATTTTSIDVSQWLVGLYFYRVVSEDGFSRSGEFVVSR